MRKAWTNPTTPTEQKRTAERRSVAVPARLTWKDQYGTTRFASVITRNVSEFGVYVECHSPGSISAGTRCARRGRVAAVTQAGAGVVGRLPGEPAKAFGRASGACIAADGRSEAAGRRGAASCGGTSARHSVSTSRD